MSATEMLEKISDSLGTSANVKSVFGEPIEAAGKTVVPVAKVAYGFGAGAGINHGKIAEGEGGGGGGGVRAFSGRCFGNYAESHAVYSVP